MKVVVGGLIVNVDSELVTWYSIFLLDSLLERKIDSSEHK